MLQLMLRAVPLLVPLLLVPVTACDETPIPRTTDTGVEDTCCFFECSDGEGGWVAFTLNNAECTEHGELQCGGGGLTLARSEFDGQCSDCDTCAPW